jgi:Small subunit of serine palmitoyltransferase-like
MPDYGHGIRDHDRTSTSYFASLRRWLQIKKYQYEVTFSLYMLTPTEKFVFSMLCLLLRFLEYILQPAPDHLETLGT